MNKLSLIWKQTTFPPTSWLCNDLGKQKQTCKAWFGARATLRVRLSFSLKSNYNIVHFPFTIGKPVPTLRACTTSWHPSLNWFEIDFFYCCITFLFFMRDRMVFYYWLQTFQWRREIATLPSVFFIGSRNEASSIWDPPLQQLMKISWLTLVFLLGTYRSRNYSVLNKVK